MSCRKLEKQGDNRSFSTMRYRVTLQKYHDIWIPDWLISSLAPLAEIIPSGMTWLLHPLPSLRDTLSVRSEGQFYEATLLAIYYPLL